jgi:hypothetical protein
LLVARLSREVFFDRFFEFGRDETKRSRRSTISNAAIAPDQVEAIRQRVVLQVGRVFQVID